MDDDDDEMMEEEEKEEEDKAVVVPKQPKLAKEVPKQKLAKESIPSKTMPSPAPKTKKADWDSPEKKGAMDAFVHPAIAPSNDQQPTRRRRKVLVEQTTVDEKGYLRTVQTEVWQDEDEVQEAPVRSKEETHRPKPVAAARPSKKTTTAPSHLKQGNLKGFFAKK
jgi:DNA polymerase subunit Cdc27